MNNGNAIMINHNNNSARHPQARNTVNHNKSYYPKSLHVEIVNQHSGWLGQRGGWCGATGYHINKE